jgi:hypothetical protein
MTYGRPDDGPTKENFRLDFSTRPLHTSVWNQRAADVFAEVYLSSDFPSQHVNKVKEEFVKRLRRLHRQYCTFLRTEKGQESGSENEMGLTPRKSTKRQRRRRRAITVRTQQLTQSQRN